MFTRAKLPFLIGAALALVVLIPAPSALAEGEIGVQGGLFLPDEPLVEPDISFKDDFEPTLGLRGLYRWDDRWGVLLDVNFATVGRSEAAGDVDTWAYRLGLEYLFPQCESDWFINGGVGLLDLDPDKGESADAEFVSVGGGYRMNIGERTLLRFELRADRTAAIDELRDETLTNLYALVGISWLTNDPPDGDGDGVIDRRDECSETPEGAMVDECGCPTDSDGDGVYDGIDKCPDTPEGWPVDEEGCPKDSDGDGVPDGEDDCPDTPEGAEVDDKGCPKDSDDDGVFDGIDRCPDTPKGAEVDEKGCPKDSDGDRVYDGIDECPDTPRGAVVDEKGCPKDTDGDGVYDGIDECPATPEYVEVDEKGCPMRELFEEDSRVLVLEGVNFAVNSADLTTADKQILERIALALKDWDQVEVEIAGHTDSTGSATYNEDLSQRRADSVRDFLVEEGIDSDRLETKGYGEEAPIADNDTAEGRAKNRRVELRRLN